MQDDDLPMLISQCHGCWWPGDVRKLKHQQPWCWHNISKHTVRPCLTYWRVLHIKSVNSNIFMGFRLYRTPINWTSWWLCKSFLYWEKTILAIRSSVMVHCDTVCNYPSSSPRTQTELNVLIYVFDLPNLEIIVFWFPGHVYYYELIKQHAINSVCAITRDFYYMYIEIPAFTKTKVPLTTL